MRQARLSSLGKVFTICVFAIALIAPSVMPASLVDHPVDIITSHAHDHVHQHHDHHQGDDAASHEKTSGHKHTHHSADHTHDVPSFANIGSLPDFWPTHSLNGRLVTLVLQDPLYRLKRPPKA